MGTSYIFEPAADVADAWHVWCGDNPWTRAARRFGELGGEIKWWCGYPRCASAIPLAFELKLPNGAQYPSNSRLKDLKGAINAAPRLQTIVPECER